MMARAILVIDDDADIRDVLCVLLEQDGYRSRGAGTAADALQCARVARFDVVCCDLHLAQEWEGYKLPATLRPWLPGARFLALTGDVSAAVVARAAQAGFAAVLVKPIDYGTLLAAIEAP